MRVRSIISGVVVACFLVSGGPLFAKKKPWDVERYAGCLKASGSDPLAPDQTITSQGCNGGRNSVDASEGAPSDLKAITFVTGARNKDNQALAFVAIAFGTRFDRVSTYVGGARLTSDNGGGLGFGSVFAMVGGRRQELTVSAHENAAPDCSFMSRGSIGATTCTFAEVGVVQLPIALLDELSKAYATDPTSLFRFRVATKTGSITFSVPVAEIEAVRRSIFPPAAAG